MLDCADMDARRRYLCLCFLILAIGTVAWPKEKDQGITLLWPNVDAPALKLIFGKFVLTAEYGGQKTYICEVVIQNLSQKRFSKASFTVRVLDKSSVRVADSTLNINDLGPGESSKIPVTVFASGVPASLSLIPLKDSFDVNTAPAGSKTVPLNVITVPSGANLKVDGIEAGVTPKIVRLTVGTHTLELNKTGYATGNTPVEIKPDEAPGGSITIELGGFAQDTVELRDGTLVLGDVVSLSMTSVVVRVNGQDQTYGRNRIKRISLVEREIVEGPPVTIPSSNQK